MQTGKPVSFKHYLLAAAVAQHLRDGCRSGEKVAFDISSMARRFTTSKTVLITSFKRRYGVSVHQFIIREKMNYAIELLAHADQSIKEISINLGYTELSNFSRDFSKHTGMAPGVWRKSYEPRAVSCEHS